MITKRGIAQIVLMACAVSCGAPQSASTPARVSEIPVIPSPNANASPGPPVCDAIAEIPRAQEALRAINGNALVLKYSVGFAETDQIVQKARANGAEDAEAFVVFQASLVSRGAVAATSMRGIGESAARHLRPYLVDGSIEGLASSDTILVGQALARALHVKVGETVLAVGDGDFDDNGEPPPRAPPRNLTVVGVFALPGLLNYAEVGVALTNRATATSLRADAHAAEPSGVTVWFPKAAATASVSLAEALSNKIYRVMTEAESNQPLDREIRLLHQYCR